MLFMKFLNKILFINLPFECCVSLYIVLSRYTDIYANGLTFQNAKLSPIATPGIIHCCKVAKLWVHSVLYWPSTVDVSRCQGLNAGREKLETSHLAMNGSCFNNSN